MKVREELKKKKMNKGSVCPVHTYMNLLGYSLGVKLEPSRILTPTPGTGAFVPSAG